MRLTLNVDDVDAPGQPPVKLWWRPDWRGTANYAGSGTFLKSVDAP